MLTLNMRLLLLAAVAALLTWVTAEAHGGGYSEENTECTYDDDDRDGHHYGHHYGHHRRHRPSYRRCRRDYTPAMIVNLTDVNLNVHDSKPVVRASWAVTDPECMGNYQVICFENSVGEGFCSDELNITQTEYETELDDCDCYAITVKAFSSCGRDREIVTDDHTVVKAYNDPWITSATESTDCGHADSYLGWDDPCGLVTRAKFCITNDQGYRKCKHSAENPTQTELYLYLTDLIIHGYEFTVDYDISYVSFDHQMYHLRDSSQISFSPPGGAGNYSLTNTSCILISSANYHDNYDPNADDTYTFVINDDSLVVHIEFLEFDLQDTSDYVKLHDGASTSSSEMATLTGSGLPTPSTYTSSGHEMTLNFVSDGSNERKGFIARVTTT